VALADQASLVVEDLDLGVTPGFAEVAGGGGAKVGENAALFGPAIRTEAMSPSGRIST